eukprot:m.591437 g.591437  ORF g.591437 m.591437 type:complete len:1419 (+) comp58016_c0_seq1:169-4425(+)
MDESSRPEGSRARAYTKSGSPPRQLLSSVSVRVEGFGRLSSGSLGRSMPNVNCDAPDDRARMKLSRHLSFRGSRPTSPTPSGTSSPSIKLLRRPSRAQTLTFKRGVSSFLLPSPSESFRTERTPMRSRAPSGGEPVRRARSLSPPRSVSDDLFDNETRLIFQDRLDRVKHQLQRNLTKFIQAVHESNDNPTEQGYAHAQLKLISEDILIQQHLTGSYFQSVTESLGKLLTRCESSSKVSQLIKKLLMMISRPARLLECLEFNPEDTARQEMGAEDRFQQLRLTAKNDHIPQYILSKLQANFGLVVDPDPADAKLMPLPAPQSVNFITENYRPRKHDFKFEKQLSAGAYGAVYLAKHMRTSEYVAIKVLKKRDLRTKNMIDQVMNERDILQFAQNPFLVTLYCSFASKESLYMVMEFAPGGDLASLLKSVYCMEEKTARRYVAETILAIEYIHEYGIIHRDLKPDNLVIGRDGHIKLTDFGLSKIGLMNRTTMIELQTTHSTSDKQVLGTPDYIAPEVILGQGYGPPVDWWSLGIILYELIVGLPPFRADSVAQLFNKTVNEEVEFPPDETCAMSAEVKDLILRLLEKDPDNRLGTVTEEVDGLAIPGATYVKEHEFFSMSFEDEGWIDFDALLQEKACFVPVMDDELDTSYFDDRSDRYTHTLSSSDSDESDPEGSASPDSTNLPFQRFDRVNVTTPLNRSPRISMSSPMPRSSPLRASFTEEAPSISRAGSYTPMELSRTAETQSPFLSEPESATVPISFDLSDKDRALSGGARSIISEAEEIFVEGSTSSTTVHPIVVEVPRTHLVHSPSLPASPKFSLAPAPKRDGDRSPPLPISRDPSDTDAEGSKKQSGRSTTTSPGAVAAAAAVAVSDVMQKRIQRQESRRKSKSKIHCSLGCESCKTVEIPWNPKTGYGFAIRCETDDYGRRHRISAVDKNGPAEAAGAELNLAIIQVNGEDVTAMQHQKVVRKIKEASAARASIELHLEYIKKGTFAKLASFLHQTSPKLHQKRLFPPFRSSMKKKKAEAEKAAAAAPPDSPTTTTSLSTPSISREPSLEHPESKSWVPSFMRSSPARSSPLVKKESSKERSHASPLLGSRLGSPPVSPQVEPVTPVRNPTHSISSKVIRSLTTLNLSKPNISRSTSNPVIIVQGVDEAGVGRVVSPLARQTSPKLPRMESSPASTSSAASAGRLPLKITRRATLSTPSSPYSPTSPTSPGTSSNGIPSSTARPLDFSELDEAPSKRDSGSFRLLEHPEPDYSEPDSEMVFTSITPQVSRVSSQQTLNSAAIMAALATLSAAPTPDPPVVEIIPPQLTVSIAEDFVVSSTDRWLLPASACKTCGLPLEKFTDDKICSCPPAFERTPTLPTADVSFPSSSLAAMAKLSATNSRSHSRSHSPQPPSAFAYLNEDAFSNVTEV